MGDRADHEPPFLVWLRLWYIAHRSAESGRVNGASLARAGRGIRDLSLRDGLDLTHYILTKHMTQDELAKFNRMLAETADQQEAREVAPLLQMMGGVKRA